MPLIILTPSRSGVVGLSCGRMTFHIFLSLAASKDHSIGIICTVKINVKCHRSI